MSIVSVRMLRGNRVVMRMRVGGFGTTYDARDRRRLQVRVTVRRIQERIMLEHFVTNVLKRFSGSDGGCLSGRRGCGCGLLHEIIFLHHLHVLVDGFDVGGAVLLLLLLLLLLMAFTLNLDGIFGR